MAQPVVFEDNIDYSGAAAGSTCWEWTGSISTHGYGKLTSTLAGKKADTLAHRLAYVIAHGPIPEGLCVCHACDNRLCVRPEHLFLGTTADNNQDMKAKCRQARGAGHGMAKLTEKDVLEIKATYRRGSATHGCYGLGGKFGVTATTISRIIHGHQWSHVSVSDNDMKEAVQ